jgi:hypothetical protein
MFTKTDQLVALRMLIAAGLPEQPAKPETTPLSRKIILSMFPRPNNNHAKENFTRRGNPIPVYGRTKEER